MAGLTVDTFRPHVGTVFTLLAGDEVRVPLELVSAEAPGEEGTRFALEFQGPGDPAYAQATVTLEHPALGTLQIFVVPVARDAEGTRYQAIFG